MRAVIQRVLESDVFVENDCVGRSREGMLIYLGVKKDDEQKDAEYLADKIVNLRIFDDEKGKMTRSLIDISGSVLVISNVTLYADFSKGRRLSFDKAASQDKANTLYLYFVQKVKEKGLLVETGQFGKMMKISSISSGPVTLILESE